MAAIAAFVDSSDGKMFAAIHDRWGADPGAYFSDDVVALNVRAALMFRYPDELGLNTEPEPEDDPWEAAARQNEREWLGR